MIGPRQSLSLAFTFFSSSPSPSANIQKMSFKQLVEDSIADNKVTIFSKSWCPYCKEVKQLFEKNFPTVKPVVYELDEREDGDSIQQYLYEKTGQRTVPNVFVNKKHIGGCDDTTESFESNELALLIAA